MSQRARLTKALAGSSFDLGVGRSLIRDRLHIDVRTEVGPRDLAAVLLERHLAEVLNESEIAVAVTFGSLRPNRKPVIQIATPLGVVSYAKVAWNELTSSLVRNEAESLQGWGSGGPRTFLVPKLLHRGVWRDKEIVVTSAFHSSVWRRGPRNAWPATDVLRELAERDGLTHGSICTAPMWADLRLRYSRPADPPAGERLSELADRFEQRFGDVDVVIGSWHGDWAPWNMTWVGRRLAIWDWERARSGVPVGMDAIHFAFQVSFRSVGRRPAEAMRRTLPLAAPVLAELGVDDLRSAALLTLYLFELYVRYEDATVEGVLSADDPIRSGILEVLSAAVEGRIR